MGVCMLPEKGVKKQYEWWVKATDSPPQQALSTDRFIKYGKKERIHAGQKKLMDSRQAHKVYW